MKLGTLIQLARPRSATDNRRMRLLVVSIGLAGAFLLAGWRIKRLGFNGGLSSSSYSNYLQEDGLRSGIAIATVLLAIAACALAIQALKLGTAARDRRLTTLRLAGATPDQVRRVGAVEAGLAGLAGGILAGPLYLLLASTVQALPRMGRVLPPPNAVDLVTWPIVAVILTAAAAVIGGTLRRGVIVDPLTATPAGPLRYRTALILGGVGLVASVLGYFSVFRGSETMLYLDLVLMIGGVVVAAAALAPVLVDQLGRRLSGSADPLKVLAGGRLIRTARSAGRTATLLVICGMAAGIGALGVAAAITDRQATPAGQVSSSFWFLVTGFGLTAAAALFTAFVAGAALVAGAADDLLDQRRQFAYLSIFGVGEAQLRRSVRHQLTSSTALALAAGLLAGCLFFRLYSRGIGPQPSVLWIVGIPIVGTGLAWLVAAAAAFLLRGQVREAIDPKNLRLP
ncbi:MAG TPA: FtsX-like permease family protein [Kribbella sp.]|jgi:hypothetical protein